MLRALRFLWRTLVHEFTTIVVAPVRALLVNRRWTGLTLAVVSCTAVIVLHAVHVTAWGNHLVRILGGVQASLPLPIALLRTPVSLYVPALNLPVWAGLTQLFLVFALAQLALGWKRTLLIAYAATLAGTMSARAMIWLGPTNPLGLDRIEAYVLDTGPSAATVALFTYIAVIKRAPVLFSLTTLTMIIESLTVPNLAGREHLIAIGTAFAFGAARLGREARGIPPGELGRGVRREAAEAASYVRRRRAITGASSG